MSIFSEFLQILSNPGLNDFKIVGESRFDELLLTQEEKREMMDGFPEKMPTGFQKLKTKVERAFSRLESFKAKTETFFTSALKNSKGTNETNGKVEPKRETSDPDEMSFLGFSGKILGFFFEPSCSMPYLRRESKYESRNSFQMHAVDMQTMEEGNSYPGASKEFQMLFDSLIESKETKEPNRATFPPFDQSNHPKHSKPNGLWGLGAVLDEEDFEETAQAYRPDPFYKEIKLKEGIREDFKDSLRKIRWGFYSNEEESLDPFETIGPNEEMGRGEKVIVVLGVVRWAAEIFCQFFSVFLEIVKEKSPKDNLLLLTLYTEGFNAYSMGIERAEREMNKFKNELQMIYGAVFQDENNEAFELFAFWKGLARIWKENVFNEVQKELFEGFEQGFEMNLAKKLIWLGGKCSEEEEEERGASFEELERNEEGQQEDKEEKEDQDGKEPIYDEMEPMRSKKDHTIPMVKYYEENGELCSFLLQEFVNSMIDIGINEVTIFRIGNSSRTLPLSKHLEPIEKVTLKSLKEFITKAFEMVRQSGKLELFLDLLNLELREILALFPKFSSFMVSEQIYSWSLDCCSMSFGLKSFGCESDFIGTRSSQKNKESKGESENNGFPERFGGQGELCIERIHRELICGSINMQGSACEKWAPVPYSFSSEEQFYAIFNAYQENKVLSKEEMEQAFRVKDSAINEGIGILDCPPQWEGIIYENF